MGSDHADRIRPNARATLRIAVYYALLIPAISLTLRLVPSIGRAMQFERDRTAKGSDFGGGGDFVQGITSGRVLDETLVIAITASLVGALAFTLPVAWAYQATHKKKGYRVEFVQTMLLLPIAIATVVFLVKGSLALAFGLAGIVAAIRFRHTLENTKDAVFVFMTIGIGLAAGAQLLTVTAIASIFFVAVVLLVAWFEFGKYEESENATEITDETSA